MTCWPGSPMPPSALHGASGPNRGPPRLRARPDMLVRRMAKALLCIGTAMRAGSVAVILRIALTAHMVPRWHEA